MIRSFKEWKYFIRDKIYVLLTGEHMPFKVALGLSLGGACNFLPTMGLGFPIAIVFALITRSSVLASLVGETLFKVLLPFFYYFNLVVGSHLVAIPHYQFDSQMLTRLGTEWTFFLVYAKAFMLGAIINMSIFISLLTVVLYIILVRYREWVMKLVKRWKEDQT
ncbi:MAG: DUF2062 domain-containing protein [Methylocystaceae bacterium]